MHGFAILFKILSANCALLFTLSSPMSLKGNRDWNPKTFAIYYGSLKGLEKGSEIGLDCPQNSIVETGKFILLVLS